jgi:lipopolysaccharide export system protein LptA
MLRDTILYKHNGKTVKLRNLAYLVKNGKKVSSIVIVGNFIIARVNKSVFTAEFADKRVLTEFANSKFRNWNTPVKELTCPLIFNYAELSKLL